MIRQEDKHKRGAAAKRKGANGERELANRIRDTWGYQVKRGMVFYGESDLVGLDGIHPEVKRTERIRIYEFMDQAVEEAAKRQDGIPTVFCKSDRKDWLVTMRLEDFMDLYGVWINER